MKDLHSHILYGIDDGSKSIEESIDILKELEKSGIDEIILTPHYIENTNYNCNNNLKEEIFNKLKKEVKKNNINIKLYLGNEVFYTNKFIELINKKEINTLNNSKYLLFEFPMTSIHNNSDLIINELTSNGYIPVLAHPERYIRIQKDVTKVDKYLREGVLLQGNILSLTGKYGYSAKKTIKYLLKHKLITFLGTDIHYVEKIDLKKIKKKLLRITKDPIYVENILNNNFTKVINNEDIGIQR
jgi:protein-tyrosine phosphatase